MTPGQVVYLVDDDAAVRAALEGLLRGLGYAVRGFASGGEFLAAAPSLPDGCILLDLRMPDRSGLEVQDDLRALGIAMPIVFLTAHGELTSGVTAMKHGARDFLQKPVREEVLVPVLDQVFRELSAKARHRAEALNARRRLEAITPREREVIALVVAGLRSRAIAARLGISYQTVKVHRMRAMTKLGTATLPQLSRLWAQAASDS